MNDLQKRTMDMAVKIFRLVQPLQKDCLLEPAIKQIIKSSTSVGANYSESQTTGTYKDFFHKIKIAQKELKETQFWITFIGSACDGKIQTGELEKEIDELIRIFATISKKADHKIKTKKKI